MTAEQQLRPIQIKQKNDNWPFAFLFAVWSICLTVLLMWWTR
jgi:hypothetical protein